MKQEIGNRDKIQSGRDFGNVKLNFDKLTPQTQIILFISLLKEVVYPLLPIHVTITFSNAKLAEEKVNFIHNDVCGRILTNVEFSGLALF